MKISAKKLVNLREALAAEDFNSGVTALLTRILDRRAELQAEIEACDADIETVLAFHDDEER